MAAPTTFDLGYPQNPWEDITSKTIPHYAADLYRNFARAAVYNRFVTVKFNMNGLGATEMYLDGVIMPHANNDPIGARDRWVDGSFMDFERRRITFSQYAGKLSFHEYDDLITRYKLNGRRGLGGIIDAGLGHMMTWTLDKLARNAFLSPNALGLFGRSTGVDFSDITTADTMTTGLIEDINLGMKERVVPYATTYDGSPGQVICITSPGVIRDLKNEVSTGGNLQNTWTDTHAYGDGIRLVRGDAGIYKGVRFLETNDAVLWNCGEIDVQPTITAAVAAGDGSPNPNSSPVDGVFYRGQVGATHSITVSSTSGLAVGDRVSIHVLRTNDFGVSNGADYRDGKFTTRRIVSIPDATHLVFDFPVMEDFAADLGGGVYGYVTKGRNIHTSIFLGSNDGVAMGVLTAPEAYVMPPVDDLRAQWRAIWKARLGYNLFNTHTFEVIYSAGSNRERGARYIR